MRKLPNYVRNTLHFACSEERLNEILEAVKYENNSESRQHGIGTFDFNKIVPMPESLNIEAGSSTDKGLKAYREFVDVYTLSEVRTDLDLLNIPAESEEIFLKMRTDIDRHDWELGRTAFQNIQKYGYPTWYEFNISKWGSKWNGLDFEDYKGGHDIHFSTAWSAPHPILMKLSEMYPDVTITHKWADEDMGNNCGEHEYYSGERTFENYPESLSKEAYDLAFEQWGVEPSDDGYALSSDGERYIYNEIDEYEQNGDIKQDLC